MITDQQNRIVRISGSGDVAESRLRVATYRVAQPKSPAPRKLLVVVALLVVVTLVGWAVKRRANSNTAAAAGTMTARGQTLPVPIVEGVVYDTQKALVSQLEATVKADEAAMASAKVNLDYTTIRSPIDGRVGIRQLDAGNIVHASDANGLVLLTQLRPISVVFTLPERALTKLQQYQNPEKDFTVLAVSRDNSISPIIPGSIVA